MISNDRSVPYGSHPHNERPHGPSKPPVQEDTLKSAKVQIERKTFVLALKENTRGRFLRITEDVGGRRDTIIIPAPGLEDFKKLLEEMVQASTEIPPKAAE
jgi:PurA ssDNA and RNA-binding protein